MCNGLARNHIPGLRFTNMFPMEGSARICCYFPITLYLNDLVSIIIDVDIKVVHNLF